MQTVRRDWRWHEEGFDWPFRDQEIGYLGKLRKQVDIVRPMGARFLGKGGTNVGGGRD